jgi:small-conductance mechanosensitive channel
MKAVGYFLVLCSFALCVNAQQPSAPPATLVFQNREIATFRVVVAGRTPAQRAQAALTRLRNLSTMSLYEQPKLETIPDGYIVTLQDEMLLALVKQDLQQGADLASEARAVQARLVEALRARAEQLSVPFMIRAVLLSIGGTILFLILLKILLLIRRKLFSILTTKAETQARLILFGFDLRRRTIGFLKILARVFLIASFLLVVYMWVTFLLNRFPYTRPWGLASRGFLISTFQNLFSGFITAVPRVLTALIILGIVRVITKLTQDFFDGVAKGTVHLPGVYPETADATRRLINTVLWLFGLVIAYPYLPGAGSDAFKGVSVFVGILFTLGSAGVVGHLMSGLVLVYSRALKKGDFVRVGDVEGVVTEVGPLSTKIVNLRKEEFTLPNTMMVSSVIKNYTRQAKTNGLAVSTSLTIGYDAPWRLVHDMLKSAAAKTEGVRKEPEPFVLQSTLSDFYVEYTLFVHIDDVMKRLFTLSVLHQNIQDAFNEQGVQIMSPHFESQPEKPVFVPKSKWYSKPSVKDDEELIGNPEVEL